MIEALHRFYSDSIQYDIPVQNIDNVRKSIEKQRRISFFYIYFRSGRNLKVDSLWKVFEALAVSFLSVLFSVKWKKNFYTTRFKDLSILAKFFITYCIIHFLVCHFVNAYGAGLHAFLVSLLAGHGKPSCPESSRFSAQ